MSYSVKRKAMDRLKKEVGTVVNTEESKDVQTDTKDDCTVIMTKEPQNNKTKLEDAGAVKETEPEIHEFTEDDDYALEQAMANIDVDKLEADMMKKALIKLKEEPPEIPVVLGTKNDYKSHTFCTIKELKCFKRYHEKYEGNTVFVTPQKMPVINVLFCGTITAMGQKKENQYIEVEDQGERIFCILDKYSEEKLLEIRARCLEAQKEKNKHPNNAHRQMLFFIRRRKHELAWNGTKVQREGPDEMIGETVRVSGKLSEEKQRRCVFVKHIQVYNKDEKEAFMGNLAMARK